MATFNGNSGNNRLVAGPENDLIFGHGGNDELHGLDADDTLHGGDGADLLFGGANGDDSLDGGPGNDEIHGVWETDKIWGGDGDDEMFGGKTGDDVLYGDGGNDRIYAGGCRDLSAVNTAYGGDGKDHVGGDCGTDKLYGDLGEDLIWGGHGDDFCWGGEGRDDVGGNQGDDVLYGDTGNDIIVGAQQQDDCYGGSGKDKVNGSTGDDRVYGGDGNDQISGGAGNDVLFPGAGRDYVNGNRGDNTVSFADLPGTKGVSINIAGKSYGKAARGDDIRNVDNVVGSENRDHLTPSKGGFAYGGGGSDVIRSEAGAVMRGDAGRDRLIGDAKKKHKDVFWVESDDVIVKFDKGQDSLKMDGSKVGVGKTLGGAGEILNRSSGHEASGSGSQFIYDQSSKTLWYDSDGTGSGNAVKVATFKGGPDSLGASDFDLI